MHRALQQRGIWPHSRVDRNVIINALFGDGSGPLARLPLKLLAQGVETREDFGRCRDAGFQLFQGYHFARPEIVSGRRLTASQTTIIQLINLAARDADTVTFWFAIAFACLGLCEGTFWTTAPLLEPRSGGLACALVNTGGNGFGLLAPLFTPIIGKHFGWDAAIVVACVACAIGGLLWLGIRAREE